MHSCEAASFNLAIAPLNLRCAVRSVPHLRSKIYMRRHENWLPRGYFFCFIFGAMNVCFKTSADTSNEARARFFSLGGKAALHSSPLFFFATADFS